MNKHNDELELIDLGAVTVETRGGGQLQEDDPEIGGRQFVAPLSAD
ncbi:benenodin family lasso peptide [Asticcacaulis sp. W401b]